MIAYLRPSVSCRLITTVVRLSQPDDVVMSIRADKHPCY